MMIDDYGDVTGQWVVSAMANTNISIIVVISRSMGGLCNGKLGEKFNEVFSELMEGDLSKACRYPSIMMMMREEF